MVTCKQIKFTCLLSLEGALLANLAVCIAASADAASGVARRISQISCWHSLFSTYTKKERGKDMKEVLRQT